MKAYIAIFNNFQVTRKYLKHNFKIRKRTTNELLLSVPESPYEDEEQGARGAKSPGENDVGEEVAAPEEGLAQSSLRMDSNMSRGWNSGVGGGFLRAAGQRVTFDPEAPPLPSHMQQFPRKIGEKVKVGSQSWTESWLELFDIGRMLRGVVFLFSLSRLIYSPSSEIIPFPCASTGLIDEGWEKIEIGRRVTPLLLRSNLRKLPLRIEGPSFRRDPPFYISYSKVLSRQPIIPRSRRSSAVERVS